MAGVNSSSIDKWWREFERDAFDALDRLLCRRAFMGSLHPNETDEILFRLFHGKSKKMLSRLDELMGQWFDTWWGKTPPAMVPDRWADILQSAFIAVGRLRLAKANRVLVDLYKNDKSWLRSIYLGPARDPEGELLRTMAICQQDRSLLPLWMSLCRWEEDVPVDYTSIGLLGLRKLPEKNGDPPGDIPNAFFKGIVYLAEAFETRKTPKLREYWLREVRAIVGLYPRRKSYWAKHFSPLLSYRPDSTPAQWLDKAIPKLSNQFKRTTALDLQPPSKEKLNQILKLVENKSLKDVRHELDPFFDANRVYAYQTGDSYFLTRTFSNIGYKIFKQDAAYALSLVEEAFAWEPYNPFLWSKLAIIESFRGNYSRAEGLLWEAKRKFPEDPHIRTELAHSLVKHGRHKLAEKIYRQAMADFPEDVVCRNGLAEVLKVQGKLKEAETVYRQTMVDFSDNVVCRTGLAEVLKAQGKYEEAETVYRQAMTGFPEDVVCCIGLAVVLCNLGRKEEAISLLEETVKKFPGNEVAKEFLEKLAGGKSLSTEDEKKLEQAAEEPVEYDIASPQDRIDIVAERQVEYTAGTDETAALSTSVPRVSTGELEKELGEMALVYWDSSISGSEETIEDETKSQAALEELVKKAPGYIPVRMLKGMWLSDYKPDEAEKFLTEQVRSYPNLFGFPLLELRVKSLKGEAIDKDRWNRLSGDFSNRSTVIKLEHSMYEMKQGNGSRLHLLEQLRKQTAKKASRLPTALQKNEEWLVETIKQGLFKDIDAGQPLTGESLATIEENLRQNERRLRNTVDQCIYSAI
jgi:tetratricopeptide (TPR) repeat protein